jgi:4-coumarate--CoA ligase
MGYLNSTEKTRKTFDEDGFLHTGDLGSVDQEGLVTIHDRIKELIKASKGSPLLMRPRTIYLTI